MGFFAEFDAWLRGILGLFIAGNTVAVARALEPAIMTCGTIYVMIWGYMHMTGKIEEPVMTGLKRILMLAFIMGSSLHMWLYNEVIVETFFRAPEQLADRIQLNGNNVATYSSVAVIDEIIFKGGDVAAALMQKGGLLDAGYWIAGAVVYAIVGLTAVYTIFLLTLSRVALAVLLALGPFFIAFLFFEYTKSFFQSWIALMANYALITILTVMVAALMMHVIDMAIVRALAAAGSITIMDGVRVCMAAGLTFIIMRQVMGMAGSLSGGAALTTFGLLSRTLGGFGRSALRNSVIFGRGILDTRSVRASMGGHMPLTRHAGYYSRRAMGAMVRAPLQAGARLAGRLRQNRITPR